MRVLLIFSCSLFQFFAFSSSAGTACQKVFQQGKSKKTTHKSQISRVDEHRLLLYRAITDLEVKAFQEKKTKNIQVSKEEVELVKSVISGMDKLGYSKSSFKKMSREKKLQVFSVLSQFIMSYYWNHLVYPVQELLLQEFNLNRKSFINFLVNFFAYDSYREFMIDIIPFFNHSQMKIQKEVLSAYIKAMENNRKKDDKPYHHPEVADIARELGSKYPNINANIAEKLLGFKSSYFEGESLFNGWFDIKESAKLLKPKLFNNFIDTKVYYEQAKMLAENIKKSNKGFIITSATAGVTLNDGFFNNLLFLANKKEIPLVIMAVNRETEFLPHVKLVEKKDGSKSYVSVLKQKIKMEKGEEVSLTEEEGLISLHEVPNVYVISYTVHLTNYLTINSIPVMPKNFHPLASLNRMLIKNAKEKVSIVAHPQLKLQVQPGGVNHIAPSVYVSTGSVSEAFYPYRANIQGRVSELAKGVHSSAAWMFSPPDKDAGLNKSSAPGLYHFKPLYEREFVEPKENQIYRGIVDKSYFYGNHGEKFPLEVEYLVLGDLHVGSTNPKMFKVLAELLKEHPKANIVLHDAFDGSSINPHESERVLASSQQAHSEMFSLEAEYRRNVEVINSLLELTEGKIYFVHSNHPLWLKRLLDSPKAYTDPINSKFATEIRFAVEMDKLDPFEYLYQERENYHKNYPRLFLREKLAEDSVYTSDPSRIVVLSPGEPLYAGTKKSPINLSIHGHNISGGRTGVGPSNIPNLGVAVVGHTHSPLIEHGVTNVGTFTRERLPYTEESALSKWMNGLGVIYKNTSRVDLFVVHPLLEKAKPITEQPLEPKDHFSKGFPSVILPDNEVLPEGQMTSTHDHYREKLKGNNKK